MKNVLVANLPDYKKNKRKFEQLLQLLRCQIYNSASFGWKKDDFIVVSNDTCITSCVSGDYVFYCTELNKICLTGSKLFGLRFLLEKTDERGIFWLHDLDAWQNNTFFCNEPEFWDAGFCQYSRPKINGGSQFWKYSGLDILQDVTDNILLTNANKEEPVLQSFCSRNDRITILDSTYNVGCSGYVKRFEQATKPITVCHFNPYNRIAWQTHRLDRDGLGYVSVSTKLESNLRKFFNDILAIELDEEGKNARSEKINGRK